MIIRSQLYGKFEIGEPILIEIISSEDLQRLKGIAQWGIPNKYYYLKGYNRFEHSLGVMLLLRRLGSSLKSQIAGLTHDISHTAFSHVIDWLKGNSKKEDFQDRQHKNYLLKSKTSKILEKYGYDPEKIAELERYPLLEKEIPELCADRIDYTLRELKLAEVKYLLEEMTIEANQVVFEGEDSALKFANSYLDRQVNHWASDEAVSRYSFFVKALVLALEDDLIVFEDFWKQDSYITGKLESSDNKKIQRILKVLERDSLEGLPKSEEVKHKKPRYVDPLFTSGRELVRLSQVNEDFRSRLKKVKKKSKEGTRLFNLPEK